MPRRQPSIIVLLRLPYMRKTRRVCITLASKVKSQPVAFQTPPRAHLKRLNIPHSDLLPTIIRVEVTVHNSLKEAVMVQTESARLSEPSLVKLRTKASMAYHLRPHSCSKFASRSICAPVSPLRIVINLLLFQTKFHTNASRDEIFAVKGFHAAILYLHAELLIILLTRIGPTFSPSIHSSTEVALHRLSKCTLKF